MHHGVWVGLVVLCVASGCVSDSPYATPAPSTSVDRDPKPFALDLFFKPGHTLATDLPGAAQSVREAAGPTSPGFVGGSLERFRGPSTAGLLVSEAQIDVHYVFDRPSASPFQPEGNPAESGHLVFWVGSNDTFVAANGTSASTAVTPGTEYQGSIGFVLPRGGWWIPPGEPIELLVVPLMANEGPPNLHYLIDAAATPSRLSLVATNASIDGPATVHEIDRHTFTIPANSGASTGATRGPASVVERGITPPLGARYVEVRVEPAPRPTGHADLDLTIRNAAAPAFASSTTPRDAERVRLFEPNLQALSRGELTAVVEAYSGVETTFDLVVFADLDAP